MVYTINLALLVSGCPTTCGHCERLGRPHPPMPLADIEIALARMRSFRNTDSGFRFEAYAMNELFEHPDPAGVQELLARYVPRGAQTDESGLIPTGGVSLGRREDWREQLERLARLGTNYLWFTLHGVGEAHDAIVGVPGAYGLVKTAMERARSVGLHVGANVFLTKENLADGANLLEQVKRLQLQETSWEVASYCPTARLRHYEAHRPELPDVQPHLEAIRSAAGAFGRRWEKPEILTESSHIAKALEGDTAEWEAPQDPEWIDLVCAPNLDIHDGDVFRPVRRYGNLEKDDPAQILEKAMEAKRTGSLITLGSDGLYFEEGPIPSVRELAETVGNPASQTMHYRRTSMRNRWLDLALAERRRRW